MIDTGRKAPPLVFPDHQPLLGPAPLFAIVAMLPSDAAAAHRARRSPGYLLRPLLQHVGLHDVPDVYTSVLHDYMALRKIDEIYTRPAYATAIFMASSHTSRTHPNAHHRTEGRSLRRPDVKQ